MLLITKIIDFKNLKISYYRENTQKNNWIPFSKIILTEEIRTQWQDVTTCNRTYKKFSFNKFKNCIKNIAKRELQKAFNDKKTYYTTTQKINKYATNLN